MKCPVSIDVAFRITFKYNGIGIILPSNKKPSKLLRILGKEVSKADGNLNKNVR